MSHKKEKMIHLGHAYYSVSLEKHGRLKLPSALLKSIPENERRSSFVTHGFGNHIFLWTKTEADKQNAFLDTLDYSDTEFKLFRNAFLLDSQSIDSDSQDRIVIPKTFLEQYQFQNEVVLLFSNGVIEVWDYNYYSSKFKMSPESLEELNKNIHARLALQNLQK